MSVCSSPQANCAVSSDKDCSAYRQDLDFFNDILSTPRTDMTSLAVFRQPRDVHSSTDYRRDPEPPVANRFTRIDL